MPLQIVDTDAMAQTGRIVHAAYAVQFTDKKVALLIEANAVRAMDVVPHGDKLAVRVKDLDTMAFPIRDVDVVIVVDDHIVGPDELARIDARRAPGEQVPSLRGEFMDSAIAIAIRDIQMPGDWRYCHVRRTVEGIALPFGGRIIGAAQGHEQLAIQGKFLHRMYAVIHTVDHIIRADMDAMRAGAEHPLAPGAQEVAVAIKDNHRVLAAVEDVHVVLGVHRDASHVDKLPARRELFPIFHRGKEQHATTDDGGHNVSPYV